MTARELQQKELGEPIWSLIQRGLHSTGHYHGTFAGRPGEKTLSALDAYLHGEGATIAIERIPAAPSPTGRPFGEVIAAIAKEEAAKNIREVGGNNRGPDIVRYQKATWLAPGAWPWCAAFTGWVIQQAIEREGPVRFLRPRTAGAWDYESWATDKNQTTGQHRLRSGGAARGVRLIKPAKAQDVRIGDIIVFTYSHIGIVVSSALEDGRIVTVEGNTGGMGANRDGDGVYRKLVHPRHLRSLIRLDR